MQKIVELIKQYDTIIIHRHNRPDGDCIGSQIGLKEIIKASYKAKTVYCVGDESEELWALGKMDTIDDCIYNDALVIILDVANTSRISDERYKLGKDSIRIDHHPKVETIANIEWIDPTYAACTEMITELCYENKDELILNTKAADALYYGMVTDTNRFLTVSVNSRTYRLAGLLLDYGIDISAIYEKIYNEDENITRLKGFVLENFSLTENGVGYIIIPKELCEMYQVDSSLSNVLVNTLSVIRKVLVYFVAIYDKFTDKIRISLRSKQLPINQIAVKYGGGGHKQASGIIVDDMNVVNCLIQDLNAYLANK